MTEKKSTKAPILIILTQTGMVPQTVTMISRLTQTRTPIPMETALEMRPTQTTTAMGFQTQMKLPMAPILLTPIPIMTG